MYRLGHVAALAHALALWARPVHASSTASSTADDHLTLDGVDNVVVGADPEHAAGPSQHVPLSARWLLDGRTQSMPLSAAIKQRLVCGAQGGSCSMLQSATATKFAFPPSAQR